MRYLRIALTLVLVLSVVATVTFAAGINRSGKFTLPQRETEQLVKAKAPALVANKQAVSIDKPTTLPKFSKKAKVSHPVVQSGRQLPAGINAAGFHGTYHVGTGQMIPSLSVMALILNLATIDGPVVMLLDDATYTEDGIAIMENGGSSDVNTITIQPNAGNTNCVITLGDNDVNGGGLVFYGAKYVTLTGTAVGEAAGSRNLTINMSGYPIADTYEAPVRVRNSQFVTVSDCIIYGGQYATAWTYGNGSVYISADSGFYNSDITVNNCELTGGHFGVFEQGNFVMNVDMWYVVEDFYTSVTNNYIHDVSEAGIQLEQSTFATVTGNTVKRVVLASTAGDSPNLYIDYPNPPSFWGWGPTLANFPQIARVSGITVWGTNAVVKNNLVDSVINNRTSAGTFGAQTMGIRVIGYGMNDPDPEFGSGSGGSLWGYTTGSMVANNIITQVYSKATQSLNMQWHAVGIKMEAGRWDTCVYNTVYMSGEELAGGQAGSSAALLIEGVTSTPPSVAGGAAGYPVWYVGLSGSTTFASYRFIAINNIFAINRTGSTGNNVCMAIQNSTSPAGYVSDYRPPSDYNVLFMGVAGNIVKDSRANVWASVYDWSSTAPTAGVDAHSQADDPTLTGVADAHINPLGFSTADGTGIVYPAITKDYYGVDRVSPVDIGAVEGTGAGAPIDAAVVSILSPNASGVPIGVPSTVTVKFQNLTFVPVVDAPYTVTITGPDPVVTLTGTVSIGAMALTTVDVPTPWTALSVGDVVVTATVTLPGDVNTANDTKLGASTASYPKTYPYTTSFETAPDQAGWFGTNDWVLGSVAGGNTKLGGAYDGDKAFVTKAGAAGAAHYSTGGIPMYLYTPWFDFSGQTAGVLSFYHSLETEVEWDRSYMEYTLDSGKTWKTLGTLNDANGVNWYSTGVYANAAGQHGNDCWDEVSALAAGTPNQAPGTAPAGSWTSNGDCLADNPVYGPNGFIFVEFNLAGITPAGDSPIGKPVVRFRYVAWTDAATSFDGWALDKFKLDVTTTPQTPANMTGKVFLDLNNSGTLDGAEVGQAGVEVTLSYFGNFKSTGTTDVNGDYTLPIALPGLYGVTCDNPIYAYTTPAVSYTYIGNGTGHADIIGRYQGGATGKVYSDYNDDGVLGVTEAGLAGFVVEIHLDSLAGDLVNSFTTGADGIYQLAVLPGNYVVAEIPQDFARQTGPTEYAITVSGDGGSGTAWYTGNNFGNFVLGNLRVGAVNDINGNGTLDPSEVTGLLSPTLANVEIRKGVDSVTTLILGSGTVYRDFGVDIGTYTMTLLGTPAQTGWVRTNAASYSRTVSTSGYGDTTAFLFFKLSKISGSAFDDANGDGVKDAGEVALVGWEVAIDGNGATTVVTDAAGAYQFAAVENGLHHVTLTAPSGWTTTLGAAGYAITPTTGSNSTGKDFGAFHNFSITGNVYRDANNNGAKDAGEIAISGLVVNLSKDAAAQPTATTDVDGNYSFTNLGPGAYIVTGTTPADYIQVEPATDYTFSGVSGLDVPDQDFGYFKGADSLKYFTFTAADFVPNYGAKVAKAWAAAKPTVPTFANLISELFTEAGTTVAPVTVGKVVAKTAKLAYVQPKKFGEVLLTFANKKAPLGHEGTPRGLDFDAKLKVMAKGLKSLPPTVQNNVAVANLMALQVNLAISDYNHVLDNTVGKLGALIINDGGTFNGMTIAAFADSANKLMTYWNFHTMAEFATVSNLAAAINNAFHGSFASYDATSWQTGGLVKFNGVATVYAGAAGLLKNPVGPAPTQRDAFVEMPVPTVYALNQNYPNPFNPTTNISFDLPQASTVTLTIYNMLGQQVATVLDQEELTEGTQEFSFNAANYASGVYFYHLTATGTDAQIFTQVKKMMLVK